MKLGYSLDFQASFQNYTVQYSQDHIQNGVNQSFIDPLLIVYNNSYLFDHRFYFRFRFFLIARMLS